MATGTAAKTKKTWAALEAELAHTMHLWLDAEYTLESPFANAKAAVRRKAGAAGQTLEERRVTVRAKVWVPSQLNEGLSNYRRDIVLTMQREDTALDNLRCLTQTLEWLRLAHVRNIQSPVVKILRQLYPEPTTQSAPPPPRQSDRVRSTGPYAVLHVSNDAPLEVAEAAYRALTRTAHPDAGGSHESMVTLNRAIEQIRARAGATSVRRRASER